MKKMCWDRKGAREESECNCVAYGLGHSLGRNGFPFSTLSIHSYFTLHHAWIKYWLLIRWTEGWERGGGRKGQNHFLSQLCSERNYYCLKEGARVPTSGHMFRVVNFELAGNLPFCRIRD